MIWACITSEQKGPLVILEGKVNGDVYRKQVVPIIYRFRKGIQNPILMEDGNSIYTAKDTQKLYQQYNGLYLLYMIQPANLPDLNPIENVWRLLKYRIQKRLPKTEEQVRQYIQEEWQKLEPVDYKQYIGNMQQRCLVVIENRGGHCQIFCVLRRINPIEEID